MGKQKPTAKRTKQESGSVADRNPTVVVIGDWFVDEHWLVAKHHTSSSSHTGDIHYLSKHEDIGRSNVSLCGASEILEVLRSFFHDQEDNYSFVGIGSWNKKDDDVLQCTLCSRHVSEKNLSPYTLVSMKVPTDENGVRKCPYQTGADSCKYGPKLKLINLDNDENASTNRVIRVYEGYGGGQPYLRYRFDWQLPSKGFDYNKLNELKNRDVRAIVIVDHGKGVITGETITELLVHIPEGNQAQWYIRSKMDNPKWMEILKEKKITARLRVIDHNLASKKKGSRCWIYGKEMGRASLELLGELAGSPIYRHDKEVPVEGLNSERAAVLLDDFATIAISRDVRSESGGKVYAISGPAREEQLIHIGRTTMFFNALIAQDLSRKYQEHDFGSQCSKALDCAIEWCKQASAAWKEEKAYFYGDYSKALIALERPEREDAKTVGEYDVKWKNWVSSSKEYGYLAEQGLEHNKKIFQLWRGKGAIKDYICVGGPKRDEINSMLARIDQYGKSRKHHHPLNCLLVSNPGWGKSFLAKCIAKHCNMSFMEFSVSQMATAQDLIGCFDAIRSHQGRTDKTVMIFMDEVNCDIEGNTAMGLLLTPIWDGSFIRNGMFQQLLPAVWMFASTASIDKLGGEPKGSDFVSRLNGPIVQLDSFRDVAGDTEVLDLNRSLEALKKSFSANPRFDVYVDHEYKKINKYMPAHIRTEQVYVGVSLLGRIWGPISKVEENVLRVLHGMVPINGIRSIEFFISQFRNIQRGIVRRENLPEKDHIEELRRHVVLPQQWEDGRLADLVEIETIVR